MSFFSPKAQSLIDATKCSYKQLGRSGLRVSVPILGGMGFGSPDGPLKWALDEDEAFPLLKAAWDRGINTWDTANNYSNGASEVIMGKALRHYGIPRHKVILMTKCWAFVGESDDVPGFFPPVGPKMDLIAATPDYINQSGEQPYAEFLWNISIDSRAGLSRQAIFNAVEASLARLQTSYIDVLQIHKFDPSVPLEETMQALHDLVRMGKVRYLGGSSMRATEFALMQFVAEKKGWTKFVSMQNQYSLLYREEEREMNYFCNMTGVGLIPYSPLCRGHLARRPDQRGSSLRSAREVASGAMRQTGWGEVDESIIRRVEEVADKRGWTMSDVALAWIEKRVASPIVGVTSIERLDDALSARGKQLTPEEELYLEELYQPKPHLL
ncbi:hypothetical protein W97_07921 [Coniosporium apollinis CBS 100218]|uniref:NADP-dependent oxidoreductase domain-containing protein n=1 Tax=Coniosporium apollinis (strain CBS 100218) TaxID=1168221 RepID=R7Z3J9_CONA1|nr:uncharacterized protein W97_07921 [Coniosporium apollinis CBS 100218]EON68663.1 hypothetical protein W97_07921 [Coniosporium apollinis CBS 100218]